MQGDPIDLVIWDCDGVLVDSEPIAARVLAAYLTTQGVPHAPADCFERYTGLSMPGVRDRVRELCGIDLPEDFEARIRDLDDAEFRRHLKPIDGVRGAIAALPVRHCVASSGSPAKIDRSLDITGLGELLEYRFSARQVARGKPAPDLFLLAAETMGTAPRHCVVIEDSLSGVRAGMAAGMRTLGFVGGGHCGPGYAAKLAETGVPRVFDRMAELPTLLGFQGLLRPRI